MDGAAGDDHSRSERVLRSMGRASERLRSLAAHATDEARERLAGRQSPSDGEADVAATSAAEAPAPTPGPDSPTPDSDEQTGTPDTETPDTPTPRSRAEAPHSEEQTDTPDTETPDTPTPRSRSEAPDSDEKTGAPAAATPDADAPDAGERSSEPEAGLGEEAGSIGDAVEPSGARGGRWRRDALLALALALVGALVGLIWSLSTPDTHTAVARAAFTKWVEPGAVDAWRARVLTHAEDPVRSAALDAPGVEAISFVTPLGRNFIDLEVTAASGSQAIDAANAAGTMLAELEDRDRIARLTEQRASRAGQIAQLDAERDAIEADMRFALEAEAEAEARVATTEAENEQRLIDIREASNGYWTLDRERNAVITRIAEFEGAMAQIDHQIASGIDFELVEPATTSNDDRAVGPLAGLVGGALAGAAMWVGTVTIVGRFD